MPEKEIKPGMNVLLTGNMYDDKAITACLPENSRAVVLSEGEYDEEWGQKWHVATKAGEAIASEQELSPIPSITPDKTGRGFGVRAFTDLYGSECSIQESSLATEGALWLGVDDEGHFNMKTEPWNQAVHGDRSTGGRMHISQGQAAALLPLLRHFVRTGRLPE